MGHTYEEDATIQLAIKRFSQQHIGPEFHYTVLHSAPHLVTGVVQLVLCACEARIGSVLQLKPSHRNTWRRSQPLVHLRAPSGAYLHTTAAKSTERPYRSTCPLQLVRSVPGRQSVPGLALMPLSTHRAFRELHHNCVPGCCRPATAGLQMTAHDLQHRQLAPTNGPL